MHVRRRWLWIPVGVIVVGGAAAAFLVLRTDSHVTPRSLDETLQNFRSRQSTTPPTTPATSDPAASDPAATAPAVSPVPLAGVYVYRTTGTDSVDALGGAHHAYPAQTTITVTTSGCQTVERWDVAVERWERRAGCLDASGETAQAFTSYHQFFGGGDTDDYTCHGDPRPLTGAPNTTWTSSCVETKETLTYHGRIVGDESMLIGGVAMQALHVHLDIEDGDARDQQTLDSWYRLGTGLLLAETGDRDTTNSSPLGDVHYHEHYEITLTSSTPLS